MKRMLIAVLFLFLFHFAFAEHKHPKQHSYLKPGAPIRMVSPDAIELDPFSTETIEIALSTPSTGELVLTPKVDSGIRLTNGGDDLSFTLSGEDSTVLTLELASQEAGQYKLMFHATLTTGNQQQFRVFGLAVYVGEQPVVSKKTHPTHMVMPAQETIY